MILSDKPKVSTAISTSYGAEVEFDHPYLLKSGVHYALRPTDGGYEIWEIQRVPGTDDYEFTKEAHHYTESA